MTTGAFLHDRRMGWHWSSRLRRATLQDCRADTGQGIGTQTNSGTKVKIDESAEDFRLIAGVQKEVQTSDPVALEEAFKIGIGHAMSHGTLRRAIAPARAISATRSKASLHGAWLIEATLRRSAEGCQSRFARSF